jgi:hypothetical protein
MAELHAVVLTVSEYVVVAVGVAAGFCAVVADKLGPVHE